MADTTTHKFGIVSNGTSATGLVVQSCNKDENVEIAEARDEKGHVAELKASNPFPGRKRTPDSFRSR